MTNPSPWSGALRPSALAHTIDPTREDERTIEDLQETPSQTQTAPMQPAPVNPWAGVKAQRLPVKSEAKPAEKKKSRKKVSAKTVQSKAARAKQNGR